MFVCSISIVSFSRVAVICFFLLGLLLMRFWHWFCPLYTILCCGNTLDFCRCGNVAVYRGKEVKKNGYYFEYYACIYTFVEKILQLVVFVPVVCTCVNFYCVKCISFVVLFVYCTQLCWTRIIHSFWTFVLARSFLQVCEEHKSGRDDAYTRNSPSNGLSINVETFKGAQKEFFSPGVSSRC